MKEKLIKEIKSLKNQCFLTFKEKEKLRQLELSLWIDYKIKID